jgi:tetratricopeptide (TPR) repeat protein
MGGFKCLERMKENEEILDAFQEIAPLFQTFYPLYIEKCRIFLNNGDYENAIDYIKSKVSIKHFEIYKILSICDLIYNGDFSSSLINLDKMWDLMISQEPKNPDLYYNNAQLFSRICDRKVDIIKKCEKMIDRSIEYSPKNTKFIIEKAYYLILYSDYEKAKKLLLTAGELNSNNKESSYHIIYCKLIMNKNKEAQEDVNFLKEVFTSVKLQIHPKLKFFDAILNISLGGKDEITETLISDAMNDHVKMVRGTLYNKYDILINTDYDFLYDLAKSIVY